MKKVVILGAGVAGLSSALKLKEAGFSVALIEKLPQTGGLCASINKDGFTFDYGPHAIHLQLTSVVDEIKKLFPDELPFHKFKSEVHFMGKFLTHPLRIKDIILGVDKVTTLKCFIDFVVARIKNRFQKSRDRSFKDWVVNRFGKGLYEIYFGPYTEKVWGLDPDNLTAYFASSRIPVKSLWEVISRAAFKRFIRFDEMDHAHSPYGRGFYYPAGGIGKLIDALTEKVNNLGGNVYLSSQILDVIIEDDSVKKVIIKQDDKEVPVECDCLLSTIPLPELLRYIKPRPAPEVLKSAKGLNFRSMVLLNLLVNKDAISENHWIYFSHKDVLFNRVYETKNFSSQTTPRGKTGLCIEITCDYDDEVWNMPEDKLFAICIKELEKVKLLSKSEVMKYFTVKIQHAYPIYTIGYEANFKNIMHYLGDISNLITYGRQGLFTYTNLDHSMDMGFKIADFLINNKSAEIKFDVRELLKKYILSY